MYILADYVNDEECEKLLDNIPHSENMLQYYVKNEEDAGEDKKNEVELKERGRPDCGRGSPKSENDVKAKPMRENFIYSSDKSSF